MFSPLKFQKNTLEKLTKQFLHLWGQSESQRYLVFKSPTGSGKTRTSIESTLGWLFFNNKWPSRLIWIADREELCEQAFQSFKEIFVHLYQELEGKVNLPSASLQVNILPECAATVSVVSCLLYTSPSPRD